MLLDTQPYTASLDTSCFQALHEKQKMEMAAELAVKKLLYSLLD
jgi:hypothetical protein